jgi:hypothetical protein
LVFAHVTGPVFPLRKSRAAGVGQADSNEIATAHPSLFGFSLPSPEHVSVTSLPALALFGVGHW